MNIEKLKELIIRKKSLHQNVDDLIMDELLSLFQGLKHYKLEEIRHFIADLSHELHKHESLSIPALVLFSQKHINKIIDADGYSSPRSQRGCKYPCKTNHSLLEIFRHTDYAP